MLHFLQNAEKFVPDFKTRFNVRVQIAKFLFRREVQGVQIFMHIGNESDKGTDKSI